MARWSEGGWKYSWWKGWQEKVHNREEWKKLLRMQGIVTFCMCQCNEWLNEKFIAWNLSGLTKMHLFLSICNWILYIGAVYMFIGKLGLVAECYSNQNMVGGQWLRRMQGCMWHCQWVMLRYILGFFFFRVARSYAAACCCITTCNTKNVIFSN